LITNVFSSALLLFSTCLYMRLCVTLCAHTYTQNHSPESWMEPNARHCMCARTTLRNTLYVVVKVQPCRTAAKPRCGALRKTLPDRCGNPQITTNHLPCQETLVCCFAVLIA
jgi:hypothetical protein